uniref:hypothetical protein n=1 Tax=Borreliella californiensis TaxID=373543 RepID=UPI003B20C37B
MPKSLKKIDSEVMEFDGSKEDNKKNIKENNKNIFCVSEAPRLNEIKVGEVYGGFLAGYVVWENLAI